jgi:hypothetical protein
MSCACMTRVRDWSQMVCGWCVFVAVVCVVGEKGEAERSKEERFILKPRTVQVLLTSSVFACLSSPRFRPSVAAHCNHIRMAISMTPGAYCCESHASFTILFCFASTKGAKPFICPRRKHTTQVAPTHTHTEMHKIPQRQRTCTHCVSLWIPCHAKGNEASATLTTNPTRRHGEISRYLAGLPLGTPKQRILM